MDRQRIQEGPRQTTGTTAQPAGANFDDLDRANERKGDKPAGRVSSANNNAMDAVREVVEQDQARQHPGKDQDRDQQGRREMEAVREVVRNEQG